MMVVAHDVTYPAPNVVVINHNTLSRQRQTISTSTSFLTHIMSLSGMFFAP